MDQEQQARNDGDGKLDEARLDGAELAEANEAGGSEPPLTIVGIGASAGGLSALKVLFSEISPPTGMAYVVVVHLSPEHESHLPDLLQPYCQMPVQQVTETTPIEADQVYIIPPNANLNTVDTHLRLSKLEEQRRQRAPIDHFFRTLADTHDGHSIGVILTGTGSDGTLGLRRIKERGGVTIVQAPEEAEYDGMPRSALAGGEIDVVARLEEMPALLLGIGHTQPRVPHATDASLRMGEQAGLLQKIFAQVRARTGHDFNQYKRSTIMRRIGRRMQLHQIEELRDYLELLRGDRAEVSRLFEDLLITVTEFFRDSEVYDLLEKQAIPRLFESKGPGDRIRVWSVGCSTGEEAYSLAILLLEEATKRDARLHMQIFASDLHEGSLKQAREGVFPDSIASDVSEERLKNFFSKENGSYRISKTIREMVVFAPHNLLKDPPFSHLDLVVCRNVLIYLQREIQREIFALFHYALNHDGLLLLGTSETIDGSELFICEDKRRCLYRRRNLPARGTHLSAFPSARRNFDTPVEVLERPTRAESFGGLHSKMVEQYAPPSLLVSTTHEIVHYSERAGRYLQMPGGEPTNNVFRLVREPLRIELRSAIHDAVAKRAIVNSKPIKITIDGETEWIVLRVRAAADSEKQGFILVIFDEIADQGAAQAPMPEAAADARVEELEGELQIYRQRIQDLVEEYETSQEEMRASNEELQSANEELRSTLEELETSKEELQSMNEELTTVNQENRHRVEELGQMTSDLQNLLAATDIATIFLDADLRIIRFTPRVSELFNIRHTDRGRPLGDLTHRLGYRELHDDARRVIDRLIPVEREVGSEAGGCFFVRVLPYRIENRIEGVVITLIDITDRKRAETARLESEDRLRLALSAARMGTWEWQVAADRHRRDPSLNQLLGLEPVESVLPIEEFFSHVHVDDRAAVRRAFESSVREGRSLDAEFRVVLPDGTVRWLRDQGDVFRGENKSVSSMAGACIDVTDRRCAEDALRESESRLAAVFSQAPVGLSVLTLDGKFTRVNGSLCKMLGRTADDLLSLEISDVTYPDDIALGQSTFNELIETGVPQSVEKRYLRANGETMFGSSGMARLDDVQGHPRAVLAVTVDMTDRRRAEAALRESEERLRLLFESATDFAILTMYPHRIVTSWSPCAAAIFGYSSPEIVGRSADILYTEDDLAAGVPVRETDVALQTGRSADERWHVRKDGSQFYASGVLTPLKDGGFRGYAKVARDLTARKQMEDALRSSRDELEVRVEERTAELLQSNQSRVALMRRLAVAQEEERLRLSRELHDQIGQLLTGLILNLRAAEDSMSKGMPATEAAQKLAVLKGLVEEIGEEVHEIALRLRPTALDDLGLVAALRNYVERWSVRSGIEVEFYASLEQRLPAEVETVLYRVVQESFNNVLKHAQATRVSILLERREGASVVAIIEDNGTGFDVDEIAESEKSRGRLGLIGMRERLLAIDGDFEVESSPGKGTTIFARVTVPANIQDQT